MTTPATLIRFCPVCRTSDDTPRHDFWLTDPNVAPHFECCAANGCPDGTCAITVWIAACDKTAAAGGPGNMPEDLRAWVTSDRVQEVLQPLYDERDAATRHFTLEDLNPAVHGAIVAAPTEMTVTR